MRTSSHQIKKKTNLVFISQFSGKRCENEIFAAVSWVLFLLLFRIKKWEIKKKMQFSNFSAINELEDIILCQTESHFRDCSITALNLWFKSDGFFNGCLNSLNWIFMCFVGFNSFSSKNSKRIELFCEFQSVNEIWVFISNSRESDCFFFGKEMSEFFFCQNMQKKGRRLWTWALTTVFFLEKKCQNFFFVKKKEED